MSNRRWLAAASTRASQRTAPKPVHTLVSPPDGVWAGLREWRGAALNRRWVWGKRDAQEADASRGDNPEPNLPTPWATDESPTTLPATLAECADLVLRTADPAMKAALSHAAYAKFVNSRGAMRVGLASPPAVPARPAAGARRAQTRPVAQDVRAGHVRRDDSQRGAHRAQRDRPRVGHRGPVLEARGGGRRRRGWRHPTEFFAIRSSRGRRVQHLGWCLQRLGEMGVRYGDIAAHNVLWEGAEATASSLPARLAVVPCMQEARGLDAGPRLVAKLQGRGDNRSAAVVRRISEEEIAHVAVGVAWFRRVCSGSSVDPGDAFRAHIGVHAPDALRVRSTTSRGSPRGWSRTGTAWGPSTGWDARGRSSWAGRTRGALVGRLAQMLAPERRRRPGGGHF